MSVKEAFLIVENTPLRHDRSTARNATCETVADELCMLFQHTGMDSEIVNALFTLLNQSVAIYFPSEFFNVTVYFLKCLINRHCTHRYGAVSDNPFASFVDVVTRREVHQSVTAPVATPHSL